MATAPNADDGYTGPTADEVFGSDDGPEISVEAAVFTAEEIADVDADDQAVADGIRERLLPILHRLPRTDLDVAIKAVAKILPVTVRALRDEVKEYHWTVEAGMKAARVATPGGSGKPSQADLLFAIARERFELIRGEDAQPYAIPTDGPRIARPLRGSGSLRAELVADFADKHGKVPASTASSSALLAVEGHALRQPATPVHLRFARVDGALWLDLGRQDGAAIVVTSKGWSLVEEGAPIVFKRTRLTSEMPIPETGGDIGLLKDVIGVLEGDAWRLVVGWLVAAVFPDIPRAVLFLAAEAGSAKTSITKMLVNTIDPSPAPTQCMPRDAKDWIIAAAGSAVVALDNLGYIRAWLSDAICRAVTGEGFARRRLYTDDDIAVTEYRRAILITGIDVSADRGDLLDRCVPVELKRIPEDKRRAEEAVFAEYEEARPLILGGLLDLLAAVLRELPNVELDRMPRMADYAKVLAALDRATGWGTLPAYLDATREALATGAAGDLVAAAVMDLLDDFETWQGTATDLLKALDDRRDGKVPKRWPSTASHLSNRVRLAAPSLRAAGYEIDDNKRDGKNRKLWTLAAPTDTDRADSNGEPGADNGKITALPLSANPRRERDSGDSNGDNGETRNPFADSAGDDTDDPWEERL